MAQFGFGLDINETADKFGYDQYQTSLLESLGAVASDNWNFNPSYSIYTNKQLEEAKSLSIQKKETPVSREILNNNKEHKRLGLFFDNDEYQSVVDIIVNRKKDERKRQSIIARGPEGSWNPFSGGFYVGASKLATGIGISLLDPINIAASFIPVFGQARFAALAARTGFKTARLTRGTVEGFAGAIVIEPLVYGLAQKVKADYDHMDSFLNITFGTIMGGGLHVGAGKLKDLNTARKFKLRQKKIKQARKENKITVDEGADAELNLYREYYPENGRIMMALEKTDPKTRKLLLEKSLNDFLLDKPNNISPIVDADPNLRNVSNTSATPKIKIKSESKIDQVELNDVEKNVVKRNSVETDSEIKSLETQLETLRTNQKDLKLKFDEDSFDVKRTKQDLDEANNKSKDLDEIIKDAINCVNGR